MEKEILDVIKKTNTFDGVYFEKFLNNPIAIDFTGNDIVRVIDVDGEVMVHVLDKDDNTEFVSFKELNNDIQFRVYADVCGHKIYDTDEFFGWVKNYLCSGDKIVVGCETNEDDGQEYAVYYVYNSCDELIGEYHTLTYLYKRY